MSRLLKRHRGRHQLVMIGHLYTDAAKEIWVVTGHDYSQRVVYIARGDSLCRCGASDLGMVWEAELEEAKHTEKAG